MNLLNPAAWNGIGIVTLVIVVGVALVFGLFRGWIVPGFIHREMLAESRRALEAKDVTVGELTTSVRKFADAASASTAAAEMQTAVMEALRQVAEERQTP